MPYLFSLGEYEDGRRRLLEALEDVDDLGLRLDELDLLHDVEGGRSRPTDVHRDRLDERRAGKVLDLLGHRRREQQGLPLALKNNMKTLLSLCVGLVE